MTCKYCGGVISDGEKFCGNCGVPAAEKQETVEKISEPTTEVREEIKPEPVVNKPAKKNSTALNIILAILGFIIGFAAYYIFKG